MKATDEREANIANAYKNKTGEKAPQILSLVVRDLYITPSPPYWRLGQAKGWFSLATESEL